MEKAEPMTAVFMPARNEEETIRENLNAIIKGIESKKINHAVIVIDGSTDKTPERIFRRVGLTSEQVERLIKKKRGTLVLPNGIILIYHKKPEGKGRNFMEAMFTLKGRTSFFKSPSSVVVNIDADALDLTEEKITGIAKELRKKQVPMLVGRHMEKGKSVSGEKHAPPPSLASASSTGFRAIRAQALHPMFQMSKAWLHTFPRKFGMDLALNFLIYGKTEADKIPKSGYELGHAEAGRHETDSVQTNQRSDVRRRYFGERENLHFPGPESLAFRERKGKPSVNRRTRK